MDVNAIAVNASAWLMFGIHTQCIDAHHLSLSLPLWIIIVTWLLVLLPFPYSLLFMIQFFFLSFHLSIIIGFVTSNSHAFFCIAIWFALIANQYFISFVTEKGSIICKLNRFADRHRIMWCLETNANWLICCGFSLSFSFFFFFSFCYENKLTSEQCRMSVCFCETIAFCCWEYFFICDWMKLNLIFVCLLFFWIGFARHQRTDIHVSTWILIQVDRHVDDDTFSYLYHTLSLFRSKNIFHAWICLELVLYNRQGALCPRVWCVRWYGKSLENALNCMIHFCCQLKMSLTWSKNGATQWEEWIRIQMCRTNACVQQSKYRHNNGLASSVNVSAFSCTPQP